MAKKSNASRLAQETHGQTELAYRRPTPPLAPLYLMHQPRPQAGKVFPPKRRFQIIVDDTTEAQLPQFVKITHAG
jgi:hypothetical protein